MSTIATATPPEPAAIPFFREILTLEERRELSRIDAWKSWWMVLSNWLFVFAVMALVVWAPNPFTVVFALFVIGTRQLGMAVVMHEAAHRTLFRNRRMNDWVGNWLAAYPVWTDTAPYRAYHLQHHAKTGTIEDPDLGLVTPFPITRASMRRKLWRDLSGQTGVKQAIAVLQRDLGTAKKRTQRDNAMTMSGGARRDVGWHKVAPVAITNGVLLLVLSLAGHPALYLLWVAAWLTTYRVVTRIRSIAEHSMVPDQGDPLRNTRTTRASWWERMLIAPNLVNYHYEHHLMMSVPHHNLPRMHRLLAERNALPEGCVAGGYREVLALAVSRGA